MVFINIFILIDNSKFSLDMATDINIRVTEPDADLMELFAGESFEEDGDDIEEDDENAVDQNDQDMSSLELEERVIPIR